MKLPHSDIIIWWRIGVGAGGIALAIAAFFSFFLYQRAITFSHQPALLAEEERPALFSPALLDDMKVFWQKRAERDID